MLYTLHQGLVCAYLITMPAILLAVPSDWGWDAARIVNWAIALLSATVLWHNRMQVPAGRKPRMLMRWVPWGLMVLGTISVALAPQVRWALIEACMWMGMVAIAWSVSRWDARGLRNLAWAMTGGITLYLVAMYAIALLGLTVGVAPTGFTLTLGYGNFRFFNHVQTVALPLLAGVMLSTDEPRLRILAGTGLMLNFPIVFYTAARGTMLGLIAAGLFAVLFYGRSARRLVLLVAATALLGKAFELAFFGEMVPHFVSAPASDLGLERSGTMLARWRLWELAVDGFVQSPWFGIGPMHFASRAYNADIVPSPHNIYLLIIAEWGLPFALTASVGLALQFTHLLRRARQAAQAPLIIAGRQDHRQMGIALTAAIVAAAADATVAGTLLPPVSQVWVLACLGWAGAWAHTQSAATGTTGATADPAPASTARKAIVAVLLCSQLALPLATRPEWQHMESFRGPPNKASNHGDYQPRFWLQGWI